MRSPVRMPARSSARRRRPRRQRARGLATSPAYGLPWRAAPSSVAVAAADLDLQAEPALVLGDAERGDAELGERRPAGPATPGRARAASRRRRVRGRRRRPRGTGGCRRSWPWRSGVAPITENLISASVSIVCSAATTSVNRGAEHVRGDDLRLRQPLLRGRGRLHPAPGQGACGTAASGGPRSTAGAAPRRRQGELATSPTPPSTRWPSPGSLYDWYRGNPKQADHRRGVRRARADPARVPRPRRPAEGDGRAGRGGHAAVPDARRRRRGRPASDDPEAAARRSRRSTGGSTRTGASPTRAASSPCPTSRCSTRRRPPTSCGRCSTRGAIVVNVRNAPVPVPGGYRSPFDPVYDPFWGLAAESGVVVATHAGQRRLRRPHPDVGAGRRRELAVPLAAARRRHQEPGGQRLLRHRDLPQGVRALPEPAAGQRGERRVVDPRPAPPARRRRQPQPRLLRAAPPRDVFGEHVWVTPFWEDDIAELLRRRSGSTGSCSAPTGRTPRAPAQPMDFVTETLAGAPGRRRAADLQGQRGRAARPRVTTRQSGRADDAPPALGGRTMTTYDHRPRPARLRGARRRPRLPRGPVHPRRRRRCSPSTSTTARSCEADGGDEPTVRGDARRRAQRHGPRGRRHRATSPTTAASCGPRSAGSASRSTARRTPTSRPGSRSGWIERIDLGTGEVTVLHDSCDGRYLRGPNDLVFDEVGGLWFTDHGKGRHASVDRGGLYYLPPGGGEVRGDRLPAARAERRRPVAGRPPRLRRRDPHRPALGVGPRRARRGAPRRGVAGHPPRRRLRRGDAVLVRLARGRGGRAHRDRRHRRRHRRRHARRRRDRRPPDPRRHHHQHRVRRVRPPAGGDHAVPLGPAGRDDLAPARPRPQRSDRERPAWPSRASRLPGRGPRPGSTSTRRPRAARRTSRPPTSCRRRPTDGYEAQEHAALAVTRKWQRQLFDAGWAGRSWPTEYGGHGGPAWQSDVVAEEQARYGVSTKMLAIALEMAAAGALRVRHPRAAAASTCPRSCGARRRGASCSPSPTPGPTSPTSRPWRAEVDGGWSVTGQKVWTSGAVSADFALLVGPDRPEPARAGPASACFALDMDAARRRRSARCGRCRVRTTSTRSSSTTSSSPRPTSSASSAVASRCCARCWRASGPRSVAARAPARPRSCGPWPTELGRAGEPLGPSGGGAGPHRERLLDLVQARAASVPAGGPVAKLLYSEHARLSANTALEILGARRHARRRPGRRALARPVPLRARPAHRWRHRRDPAHHHRRAWASASPAEPRLSDRFRLDGVGPEAGDLVGHRVEVVVAPLLDEPQLGERGRPSSRGPARRSRDRRPGPRSRPSAAGGWPARPDRRSASGAASGPRSRGRRSGRPLR